jgi:hypothetical protein
MNSQSLTCKSITCLISGTAPIVGLGFVNGKLIGLGDIELQNFEEINIIPHDYCYIGGVENGHIKKKICHEGFMTDLLVMSPGIEYSIIKLPSENILTLYRVTFNV